MDKKKWKIQPNGEGFPVSIFDVPSEEDRVANGGPKGGISPYVSNGIAVVVTIVWAVSFIADIVSVEYAPPTAIHVAFMAIIGAIFGFQLVQGKGDK